MNKIILFSGGLDSLALIELSKDDNLLLIHFEYNHRAREAEKSAVISIYEKIKTERIKLRIIDLSSMIQTNNTDKINLIPNRNAIFLNVAISIAVLNDYSIIEYGAMQNDYQDYPDCRKEFVDMMNLNSRLWNVEIRAPLLDNNKSNIVSIVPNHLRELTSSCYYPSLISGSFISCRKCNSCLENDL